MDKPASKPSILDSNSARPSHLAVDEIPSSPLKPTESCMKLDSYEPKGPTWAEQIRQLKAIKSIHETKYEYSQNGYTLKALFVVSKEREKIQKEFQKELVKLKFTQLRRKQKLLEKRDKFLVGELTDEFPDYEVPYMRAFTSVEQIAQNITRYEEGVQELNEEEEAERLRKKAQAEADDETISMGGKSGFTTINKTEGHQPRAQTPDRSGNPDAAKSERPPTQESSKRPKQTITLDGFSSRTGKTGKSGKS